MEALANLLKLQPGEAAFTVAAFFLAGVIRGFSGFGSSAMIMASVTLILPPVALIPICWLLEIAASATMIRAGIRDGDHGVVAALTFGLLIGGPIGLWLVTSVPVETSKLMALLVVLTLAVLQLARIKAPFLATRAGLYGAGVASGFAYGLAGVGGMVVALYVLARETPSRVMRGSLVLYLLVSAPFGGALLYFYGMMSELALIRGAVLTIPALIGVQVGARLFIPRLERFYRPLCLGVVIAAAGIGSLRLLA